MIKVHTDTVAMEGTITDTDTAEVRTVTEEDTAVAIIAEDTEAIGHIKLIPFSSDAVGNYKTRVFLLQKKNIYTHLFLDRSIFFVHLPFYYPTTPSLSTESRTQCENDIVTNYERSSISNTITHSW